MVDCWMVHLEFWGPCVGDLRGAWGREEKHSSGDNWRNELESEVIRSWYEEVRVMPGIYFEESFERKARSIWAKELLGNDMRVDGGAYYWCPGVKWHFPHACGRLEPLDTELTRILQTPARHPYSPESKHLFLSTWSRDERLHRSPLLFQWRKLTAHLDPGDSPVKIPPANNHLKTNSSRSVCSRLEVWVGFTTRQSSFHSRAFLFREKNRAR